MTSTDEEKPVHGLHRDRPGWRWPGLLAILFSAQLLVVCNILIIPPILPFVTRDLALTTWQTTALLTSFPAMALVTNFCIGPITDRTGILHIFRLGLLLVTLCFLGSALAPNGEALIFMRVLSGMAFPMIGMTTFALAAENNPGAPGRRMIALISGTASFGPLVMLPFGMFFADMRSWRAVFGILAVSALMALAASWLIRDLKGGTRLAQPSTHTRRSLVANSEIRAILVAYFLQSLGSFTIIAIFPSIIAVAYEDTTRRIA
ncbi:MAG: MFS transporter, partial [Gammaproteobacteria bacterium]|nr:MFS transporter [Gammaproteobacteria bacterium]